jgi:hypothetical protein
MNSSIPSQTPNGSERRRNPRLRELVDEMMASIRAAANVDLWTADERIRCQTDMARIMEAVREHAVEHAVEHPRTVS